MFQVAPCAPRKQLQVTSVALQPSSIAQALQALHDWHELCGSRIPFAGVLELHADDTQGGALLRSLLAAKQEAYAARSFQDNPKKIPRGAAASFAANPRKIPGLHPALQEALERKQERKEWRRIRRSS